MTVRQPPSRGCSAGLIGMIKYPFCATLPSYRVSLQAKFKDPSLTQEDVDSLAQDYLDSMEKGTFKDRGWPQSAYGVSKVLLNAYTRVLAKRLAGRPDGQK